MTESSSGSICTLLPRKTAAESITARMMFGYAEHRQMWPARAAFTWSSFGLGFLSRSPFAVTTHPAVQKPQSAATRIWPMRCNGCRFFSSPTPSMVRIFLPTASVAKVWQEYSGVPSTSTLQAPQLARFQLRLVPVRPSFIEITSHNVVRASYSAGYSLPLTRKDAFSFANGFGNAGRVVGAANNVSPVTAVSTTPDPAALRKFLRE